MIKKVKVDVPLNVPPDARPEFGAAGETRGHGSAKAIPSFGGFLKWGIPQNGRLIHG